MTAAITAWAGPLLGLTLGDPGETPGELLLFIVGILAFASFCAAAYGRDKGYPFFPLFFAAFFIPGAGFAIVILVVTIAAGRESA